jgi:hypothetical protein
MLIRRRARLRLCGKVCAKQEGYTSWARELALEPLVP